MKVLQLAVGPLNVNCYIAYCSKTNQAAVIDPGGDAALILECLNQHQLTAVCIINTHGHADHIGANDALRAATGAPVMIHRNDAAMLTSAELNLSGLVSGALTLQPAERLLEDGETITVGQIQLEIFHTPGHTPGGICLYYDNTLFSGDTLFYQSVGRTDLPGGSTSQLITSIRQTLMCLPDNTKVLPGHGSETMIGWERANNPFI